MTVSSTSAHERSAPSPLPSTSPLSCAAKVALCALVVFLLSAVAVGVLYGMKLNAFLPIPFAVGGLSFVIFIISGSIALCQGCKQRAKPQEESLQAWITRDSDRVGGEVPVLPSDLLLPPHSEGEEVLSMSPNKDFAWVLDIVQTVQSRDSKESAEESTKKALCALCTIDNDPKKLTEKGKALVATHGSLIYMQAPKTNPNGIDFDFWGNVFTRDSDRLIGYEGILTRSLRELRTKLHDASH